MISTFHSARAKSVTIMLAGAVIFCSRGVIADPSEYSATPGNARVAANQINGAIEWQSENGYWKKAYPSRPYYNNKTEYGIYEPAYRFGTESFDKYNGKRFEDIDEADLRAGWEKMKDKSHLSWEKAKEAVHDAYERMYNRATSNAPTD